jgi:hypothetical protein
MCTPPRLDLTAGDVMDTGGQFSMRNVAASNSSAVTLGNTSSSDPSAFQYLTPILQNRVLTYVKALFQLHGAESMRT